jgi:tetratricopeptide (TPR) repeat protein
MGGTDASGWLAAFRLDPERAVSDLLWNRFYFGPLNLTERAQLLANWLEILGDSEGFSSQLDAQFAQWIERNWKRFDQPAASMVSAWTCLSSVIEFSAKMNGAVRLSNAAASLWARFYVRERFLGSFSTAPAADPLGLYLAVIAEFQIDRSLAGFWHQLCNLPDGVPFYHGRYAILGLRRPKAANPTENGSLRAEVVLGMLRLAGALDRLVRERGLHEGLAKSTFRRIAVQLAAACPDSTRWGEHGLAQTLEMPERPQKWVLESVRPLAVAVRQEHARADRPHPRPMPSVQADPAWSRRAILLADELRKGRIECLPEIERLLDDQRRYAEATGDTYNIVRSLCNFASRILPFRPELAGRWAEEARGWEPHNSFTWTTIRDVFLRQGNVRRALRFAWIGWKRFPENVVAHAGLAEVLKADERYSEAEQVYRQTVERFPEDVVARSGLAEVLKAEERYSDAEEVYRQTVERFPENVVARNGLADTLSRAQRRADAERVYRDSIETGRLDAATFVGLAYLLLRSGETGRAEALSFVERALALNPCDAYAVPLKQKLQHAHDDEVSAIAEEWDGLADQLLAVSRTSAEENRAGFEESDVSDIQTGQSDAERSVAVPQMAMPAVPTPMAEANFAEEQDAASLEVAALVAEAYFYRSWAMRGPMDAAPARQEKAAALLARAEDLAPLDAQVAAGKAALQWCRGDREQARLSVLTRLDRQKGAAPLLVLKARLDRETARSEQRRLSEQALAGLLEAPGRLRDLDLALMPVFHLEKGLAALALLDGAVRTEGAANAFTAFRHTVSRRAAAESADRQASRDARERNRPRFHEWLQGTPNSRLFPGVPDPETVLPEDVAVVERILSERPFAFDELEDTIVDRLAFATL